ncbi:hypothetical protein EV714DRAFT_269572 [Schizophyllum commune]
MTDAASRVDSRHAWHIPCLSPSSPPQTPHEGPVMSALFNFQSLLLVILLVICTCTYVRGIMPRLIDRNKEGFLGLFWMSARIGERLSPYVALACVAMAVKILME